MSCHYSCGSCSASVLMFKCLSCPATRQLIDNTCMCANGYYEVQQPQCILKQNASTFQVLVLPIAEGLYYTNIILFWIYVIATFCRVNSPKIRMTVNFGQVIALVLYYPYLFDQISKQFLQAISVLNFSYLLKLYTCQDSTVCKLFEYIWEPALILPCLICCFLISYFLMNLCYRYILRQPIPLKKYWSIHWTFIIFFFLDLTAVIFGYNITKSIMLSYWGLIFAAIYLIILIIMLTYFFRLINSNEQAKVLYRAKEGWAYGYDQNYHLYFIDYLYEEGRKFSKPTPKVQSSAAGQQAQQKQKEDLIKKFIPHSNLYIFQILFKVLMGATTVALYEYKPVLVVFSLVFLVFVITCWLGVFLYYDKSSLFVYFILSVCILICASTYWISIYWLIAMTISLLITGLMGGVFVILFFMNAKINDKIANRIFLDEQQESVNPVAENISQQELIKANKNQEIHQVRQESDIHQQQNQPVDLSNPDYQKTKRQPFQGNLTRKTKTITSQTNHLQDPQIIKAPQTPREKQQRPKGKTIFKNNDEGPRQTIIKPTSYQAKLSQLMSKVAAKNKAKSAFQQLENKQEGVQAKQTNLNNQNTNSRQKLNSRITNQKQPRTAKSKQQDLLSNIFEQPGQQHKKSQLRSLQNNDPTNQKDDKLQK